MQDEQIIYAIIHIYSDIASRWDFLEILYYLEQKYENWKSEFIQQTRITGECETYKYHQPVRLQ